MTDDVKELRRALEFRAIVSRRSYLGLAYSAPRIARGAIPYLDAYPPSGWRYLKVADRNLLYVMPWWLYYPVRLWIHRQQAFYTPLMALGLWRLREHGGFYNEGVWTWRFWRPLTVDVGGTTLTTLRWPFLWFLRGWPCS